MIEGFRIEMNTTDLQKHMLAKATEHIKLAGECETHLAKFAKAKEHGLEIARYRRMGEWDDLAKLGEAEVKQLMSIHKERAKYLEFAAARLPQNEIFRLAREDQFALEMIGTFLQTLAARGGELTVF